MSEKLMLLSGLLIIADLVICMVIAQVTKNSAQDEKDYFLAGKNTGPVLLLLTAWASFSGAGNFIGQAGRGALYGISAYWAWAGETLIGGIVIALLIAPYLARFSYVSMPHYIAGHLYGNDKYVRVLGGVAALLPNIVWPGAQIMGIAYVMEQAFGIDYRISVIICGVVLIAHTTTGGLKAVIYADALHGIIQMIFAAAVLFFGLKMFNFDYHTLKESVVAVRPEHWNLFVDKPQVIITSFLTGLVGATSNSIFWNRAFAAKDVKTARNSYGITFFFNILLVFLITAIGLSAFAQNPQVGDQALVWAIVQKMPKGVAVLLPVGVFAACMSCADTHLNCAAANIVVDILDQFFVIPDEKRVTYAKLSTLFAGIIAVLCGLFADYIYALGTFGYTVCGGVLIPLFIMGLLTRDRSLKTPASKLNINAVRIGAAGGVICALAFEMVPSLYQIFRGGVLPAILVTVFVTLGLHLYYGYHKNR